ncbi:MAG: DUF4097 family beta strand repeat-containing protein, partial [Candidatus Eisenbacteria bacterium]
GRRIARTDTTIVVRPGMKLMLSNYGGSVTIHTWPRNAVKVLAEYGRRDWIDFREVEGALRMASQSRRGPSGSFDYNLTVPAWMPVALSGTYNDVSVDGLQGGLDVETVRGNIVVRRAAGVIGLRTIEGAVDIVGANGRIAASSVNEAVRIAQAAGTIAAEAVNGDIHLLDLDSRDVVATTVNGDVIYNGRILDGGAYRFTTHSGDISVGLSEADNATVSVSTFSGDFASSFAIQPRRSNKGERFSFVLGSGKAKVDLESFQGSIELLRPDGPLLRARVAEAWKEHAFAKEFSSEFLKKFDKNWKWELKGAAPMPEAADDGEGDDGN